MTSGTFKRIGVALGLLALCTVSIVRIARPPRAVPATAADTAFSAERAMRHVVRIAERPHPMGTADHDRVRDYIVAQFSSLGLTPQIQQTTAIGTRDRHAGRVQNILARLPGTDPSGKAVLLLVHYDGIEAGPSASDDAAGCAAVLETLRALRASKQPLAHDVIALFTDGEESGLLGAAAFVREHPWAKDIAVVLNFEARGTNGRSVMFETGPGNLDAVRALRNARDATAGSVYATLYRTLPNDTDLSEIAVLGIPALNFAFADGIERYHTNHDDVAHLDPGSLQHHGSQMLAMARTFGNEPLPRARTGDGVFFDLPIVGLIVYPQGLELPLAILALVFVGTLVVRDRKGVGTGVLAAVVALVLSGAIGWVVGRMLDGPAVWSGLYATAIALLALSVTAACHAVGERWSTPRGLHVGALIVWLVLVLVLAIRAPGVAYLFTWPLLFAAGAAHLTRGRELAGWATVVVTVFILVGFIYGVSVIMLGVAGAGAIALCVVTSFVAVLLAPQLALIAGDARWSGALWLAGAGVVCLAIAALTVRPSADHPLRSALVYAEHADSSDAWLGTFSRSTNEWTRDAIGAATPTPAWTARLSAYANRFTGRRVPRVPLGVPGATLIRDTLIEGARQIVLRVSAPPGTIALVMRARGAPVLASSIDGRVVDTTRYRYRARDWFMQYWAVPDTGAIVALSIPAGSHIDFDLAARRPGIPPIPGLEIPPRPPHVVPSQTGDVNIVYRQWRF
ncbi:MAG: M20/M25/M40 family metallo-hydrolase [Gemmatimonadaceae bacterium]